MVERIKTVNGKDVFYFRPTSEDIKSLKVGDLAPDAFGNLRPIMSISAKKNDINGKLFINYATKFGDDSTMTNSMKEGKVVRTVRLTNILNSAEIDILEET